MPFDIYSLTPREFNSYGSRRGNDDVMARGTFANIRLVNKFVGKPGPRTIHIASGEEVGRSKSVCVVWGGWGSIYFAYYVGYTCPKAS